MLLSLAVWLYITLLCFAWGHLLLGLIRKWWPVTDAVLFPLVCFTGLLFIGVCCNWASLILPLSAVVHGVILITGLTWYGFRRHRLLLRNALRAMLSDTSKPVIFLFLVCCLLVLLLSTHTIHHPDTLAYHTQAILWMEKFKAVPGLVHLDCETAMANTWFGLQAIFRFGFLYQNPWLFVNGCVLCWFFLFVCHHIHTAREQAAKGLAWWLLLVFSLVSWTAVRLTAASASPDFIATLCMWAAFYSAWQYRPQQPPFSAHLFLAALFSIVAVTIKLSAAIILLIPLLLFVMALINRSTPRAFMILLIGVLSIVPYCARNVISAGYPLFPSQALNVFDVDWKLSLNELVAFQHYITAYARYPVTRYAVAEAAYVLPLATWVPKWWSNLAIEEQLLISVIIILLVYNFFTLKEQARHRSRNENILLLIALAGSIFWFYKAPAIRFGTGYLIPLVYLLSRGVVPAFPAKLQQWYRKIMPGLLIGTAILIAGYCGWRVLKFCTPSQILVPRGVKEIPYQKIECQGVTLYRTLEDDACGFIPLPCALDSCQRFQLRGNDITEGFKANRLSPAVDSTH